MLQGSGQSCDCTLYNFLDNYTKLSAALSFSEVTSSGVWCMNYPIFPIDHETLNSFLNHQVINNFWKKYQK